MGSKSAETREAERALARRTADVVAAARETCSPGQRTRAARSTLAEALADLDAAEVRLANAREVDRREALPENAGRHAAPVDDGDREA